MFHLIWDAVALRSSLCHLPHESVFLKNPKKWLPRKQIAGNAVKHASEDLVIAAREASSFDEVEQSSEVIIDSRRVGGIAQEMMAQEEILRKERELNAAREKLAQIRRMRYKDQSDSE